MAVYGHYVDRHAHHRGMPHPLAPRRWTEDAATRSMCPRNSAILGAVL